MKELYEAQAKIISAMAHPTRLMIVDELRNGPKCVCELTDLAGVDTSTVSKHLSILKNAGIISDEKKGLKVFYSLQMPCILNFFSCVDSVIKAKSDEMLRLMDAAGKMPEKPVRNNWIKGKTDEPE
jgi:DNA-binding transcriptional ArsR family regulator